MCRSSFLCVCVCVCARVGGYLQLEQQKIDEGEASLTEEETSSSDEESSDWDEEKLEDLDDIVKVSG